MTRSRITAALLAATTAAMAVVALMTFTVAAAEMPVAPVAPPAHEQLGGDAHDLDTGNLAPGDDLPTQDIDIAPAHQGPFRMKARIEGPAALVHCVHVRISSKAGVVLYDGPLDGATATGEIPPDGDRLSVAMQLDPTAGNDAQGRALSVGWDLTLVTGLH